MNRQFDAKEVLQMLESDSEDDFDGYVEENYEEMEEEEEGEEDDGGENDENRENDDAMSESDAASVSSCDLAPSSIQTSGCTQDMTGKTPVEFVQLFLTDDILDRIVKETNKYASDYIDKTDLSPHSRARSWKPCTRKELKKFLAITIAMSIDSKPRIEDYWSTSWPFSTKAFSSIMSRNKFQLLLQFLHLNDAKGYIKRGEQGYDPLYKIRPLMECLIKSFKSMYRLGKQIAIDESMIGFKGRLWFIQYMPKKPTKWGMKAYVLADSVSGYTHSWQLYAGKDDSLTSSGNSVTEGIVLKLIEGLKDRDHHLYCDSYYTSPDLFLSLKEKGFEACGTVRTNRKGIPAKFKEKEKMKKGEVAYGLTNGGDLIVQWMDKRPVTMLTTNRDRSLKPQTSRTRRSETGVEVIDKPISIVKYNTYMGGVDKSNQLLSYYTFHHRTVKWWKRAAFHLLNLAYVNAYIIYTETNIPGRRLIHELFLVQVAKGLLLQVGMEENELEDLDEVISARPGEEVPSCLRLSGRHFNEKLPSCSSERIRQCVCVCCNRKKGRQTVTTTYRCKQCKVALCPTLCFELYHTKVDPTHYLPSV